MPIAIRTGLYWAALARSYAAIRSSVPLSAGATDCSNNRTSRKQRATPAVARIFDGEKEAKLIALACSKPPKGLARWTLRLLEKKVVELQIVDRASDSTIGRTLKKTFSNPIADSAGSSRRRPIARS